MSLPSSIPPLSVLDPGAPIYQAMPPLILQPKPPLSQILPSIFQLAEFLSCYLPPRHRDVEFVYHNPNYRPKMPQQPSQSQSQRQLEQKTQTEPRLDQSLPQPEPASAPIPETPTRKLPTSEAQVSRLILSITPTPGFYTAQNLPSTLLVPQQNQGGHGKPLSFLHRPFLLDRKRLKRGTFVLASHTSFDEVLTVGYNVHLAERLGMHIDSDTVTHEARESGNEISGVERQGAVCLKGYKGDPERKIGIVGPLVHEHGAGSAEGGKRKGIKTEEMLRRIKREFGTWDSIHGFEGNDTFNTNDDNNSNNDVSNSDDNDENEIKVLAIMNAFHPEEVNRVLEAAISNHWINNEQDENAGSQILYLTGQAREPGLIAAREKGLRVVCVGHRVCEEWGIRFLAQEVRREFPVLEVLEVLEEEEPLPPRVRKERVVPPVTAAAAGEVKVVKQRKRKLGGPEGTENEVGLAHDI